ncbi:MAG: DUF1847 domain-containing protein [Desulfobacterales bacterium]|nr:DUF1847 domain-containing protein [Desulfobacterales bacterium]
MEAGRGACSHRALGDRLVHARRARRASPRAGGCTLRRDAPGHILTEALAMHVDCASCDRYACRAGRPDADAGRLPHEGPFPSYEDLYPNDDARARSSTTPPGWRRTGTAGGRASTRWRRLSRRLGYQRLGVACCPDMGREAHLTAAALRSEGLHVVVPDPGTDCDPVGQAASLAAAGTQLNVLAGMCVGHDALFIRHSRARRSPPWWSGTAAWRTTRSPPSTRGRAT